jgi:hypothetical protein
MLPCACLCHRTPKRIRLKIAQKRGNAAYFRSLAEKFSHFRKFDVLEANPRTGSVLIVDDHIDIHAITAFGKTAQLFNLETAMEKPLPLSRQMVEPFANFNNSLAKTSGGYLDLPGVIFLFLLGFGVYEILKGNFKSPPWYNLFWYAFGALSKTISDNFR